MTAEEEVIGLRQEKSLLQEQLAQRDALIAQMQHELVLLREQVHVLQEQLNKDSHNSHLPPSSDRFHRQSKSLRKSSGKQPGGQIGHPGSTLILSPTPDQVIVHAVQCCQHCQRDLREMESLAVERRQVLDLPPKRVVVIEHQAQQKWCPACHEISIATFPDEVRAPVQYGAAFGAVGVYLVQQQLLPYERACLRDGRSAGD
jgi:transposase